MSQGFLLVGLWLLGLAVAVARRNWVWFGTAAVVGVVAALVQGGATLLVRGVHEDAASAGALASSLGWVGLGNLAGAALLWWRRR